MGNIHRRQVIRAGLGLLGMASLSRFSPSLAQQDSLRIGVVLSYSGPYARLGQEITRGMELYLDKVGYQAGGRRIQLLKEDEEADPAVAVRKVRKLVEQDRVNLLAGIVLSSSAYAVRDYVHERQVPLIVANAAANGITRERRSPYIFRTSISAWQQHYPMGPWVARNVGKKAFLLALDYAFGKEATAAFKEGFQQAGGEVVAELYTPLGSTDYSAVISRIASARPEVVHAVLSGSDAVIFLRQFAQFGLNRTVQLAVSGEVTDENVLEAIGEAALGAKSADHWVYTLNNSTNRDFIKAYRQKYNATPNHFAVRGYDAMQFIVDAINAAEGDVDNRRRFLRAFENAKIISPRGFVQMDPETNNATQHVYAREVARVEGVLANRQLADLGIVRDPGK
ncbi:MULTISPECIES: ABC transporter substrate-binding protein [unclassified Meiothermus]|uniref:ABC transporter substrate-binding protein n=1 Tax=unclassified Meiothermus TaxID=370471 RepID=UPI000D7D0195|nr:MULTISPECIES: ABC transporter substrate-binding protein [unclassified Meiothermus]PZA07676.1 ABC transporter substrate-binding protein [Meiothermus sp. Pnk-1]RYM36513.1 ABC transporter substrate-binding protein [Meiothermus sp. PNK-Is4]